MEIRWLGRVDYDEAWSLQREVHDRIATGSAPDTVLLLEHDSVYTAGRRTSDADRPRAGSARVIDVDRGGTITWHGPGQLVGYPIIRLGEPLDVVAYVRRLEDVLIDTCTEVGLEVSRVEGRSGVWTAVDNPGGRGARKVAAIGVRVARGVTMHGFALNANPDLAAYDEIVACGIRDAGVTSLSRELGRDVPIADLLPLVEALLPSLTGASV